MVEVPSFESVSSDKRAYARANMTEYNEHDPIVGKAILQRHGRELLVCNPPAMPLTTEELDRVFELPYVREPHPMYDQMGGVPAHRGGPLLRHPQPRLLRRLQFLFPGLPPGAHHLLPQP